AGSGRGRGAGLRQRVRRCNAWPPPKSGGSRVRSFRASSERPRRSPGPLAHVPSAGRGRRAEPEGLQDAVEVQLGQATGQVGDAELVEEVLQLGRCEIQTKAVE